MTIGSGICVEHTQKDGEQPRGFAFVRHCSFVKIELSHHKLKLFSSFEKMIITGIRQLARPLSFQLSNAVAPHIISVTKKQISNLQANLDYVSCSYNSEAGVDKIDDKAKLSLYQKMLKHACV